MIQYKHLPFEVSVGLKLPQHLLSTVRIPTGATLSRQPLLEITDREVDLGLKLPRSVSPASLNQEKKLIFPQ